MHIKTSLEKSKGGHNLIGPITSPKPGPRLNVEADAEIQVKKSSPLNDSNNAENANVSI